MQCTTRYGVHADICSQQDMVCADICSVQQDMVCGDICSYSQQDMVCADICSAQQDMVYMVIYAVYNKIWCVLI